MKCEKQQFKLCTLPHLHSFGSYIAAVGVFFRCCISKSCKYYSEFGGDGLTNINTHQSFACQTILVLLAPVGAVPLSTPMIALSTSFYNVNKLTAQQKSRHILTYAGLSATVIDVSNVAGALEAPNQIRTTTTITADVDRQVIGAFVVIWQNNK